MFKVGDRVKLTEVGEKYLSQSGGREGTVTRAGEWSDVRWDNGHENNYEVEDLIVVGAVVAQAAATEEQTEVASRIKYLYSVETADGVKITSTADREHARNVKAYCGGKKEGVIIMAYAPVKEIR